MDLLWQAAPLPALHLRRADGERVLTPNDAARRWAALHGLSHEHLVALAEAAELQCARRAAQAGAAGCVEGSEAPPVGPTDPAAPVSPSPDVLDLPLGTQRVRLTRVALPDAVLLWCSSPPPGPPAAEPADHALARAQRATQFLDRALVLGGISVWRLDLATGRMHFNAVGFRDNALPQDPEGVPLAVIRETTHPDDRAAVIRAAEEALAHERVVDLVARYRNADGSWRTLLTRRVADRDEHGHALGLAGVSLDISAQRAERERAEALIEGSRLAAETLGVGFWRRDFEADRLEWDEQLYRIHRRDLTLGPPSYAEWIDLLVHPADQAWVRERVRQAEAGWEPTTDFLFRAPDRGEGERWIQSWARRLVRNGRRIALGMHLDVTARQHHQMLLQRERERAQMAVNAAQVGVWERDADGRLIYWNEVMYRQRGLDPDDARSVHELAELVTHPDDWAEVQARVRHHFETDEPYAWELRVRRPDGSWRWVTTQGHARRDVEGRVLGMAGVHIDITDRRHAEALQRETQRLEQASRDKSAFLARMSHELRTPMNAVLGFARLLEDDVREPPTPRQRERLARITASGEQLLALIDDVLEVAKLDAQADTGPAESLLLERWIDDALATVAGAAERAGVRLSVSPLPPGAVRGQHRRLVQALGHVMLQALAVCPPGSALCLAARLDPSPEPAAEDARAGLVRLAIGLRAEAATGQRSLFGASTPTATQPAAGRGDALPPDGLAVSALAGIGGSAGLGLDLARSLLQPLGGRVEAVGDGDATRADLGAEPQQDAGFAAAADALAGDAPLRGLCTVVLPAVLPPTRMPAGAGALRVLCIEDNPVNLQLVRELLALRPAVQLRTAEDGSSGLRAAIAEPPDLVLLDLQLPDLNGMEVMRRLRVVPATAACRIVALSADAMPDHIAHAMAAGFDDYWTKPIQFDRFLADIDRIAAGC